MLASTLRSQEELPQRPSVLAKMGRGKAWSHTEQLALARAWVRVSESPLAGADQKLGVFWGQVLSAFARLGNDYGIDVSSPSSKGRWKHRNWRSALSQHKVIFAACQKLNGLLKRVKDLGPTGFNSEEDFVKGAIALMSSLSAHDAAKKDAGSFELLGHWKILRSIPKFQDTGCMREPPNAAREANAASPGDSDAHPSDSSHDSSAEASPGPQVDSKPAVKARGGHLGAKRAKRELEGKAHDESARKRMKEMADSSARRSELLEDAVMLKKKRLEQKDEEFRLKLFTSKDLQGPPEAKEHLAMIARKHLDAMKNPGGKDGGDSSDSK